MSSTSMQRCLLMIAVTLDKKSLLLHKNTQTATKKFNFHKARRLPILVSMQLYLYLTMPHVCFFTNILYFSTLYSVCLAFLLNISKPCALVLLLLHFLSLFYLLNSPWRKKEERKRIKIKKYFSKDFG